jgi:hypothetical protein
MTYTPTARQQLGKHIPEGANARNNRTSIARQRISKHASLTIEAVFSAWSVQSGYKQPFGSTEEYRTVVESGRVEFRVASLPGYVLESREIELSRVSELAAAE